VQWQGKELGGEGHAWGFSCAERKRFGAHGDLRSKRVGGSRGNPPEIVPDFLSRGLLSAFGGDKNIMCIYGRLQGYHREGGGTIVAGRTRVIHTSRRSARKRAPGGESNYLVARTVFMWKKTQGES